MKSWPTLLGGTPKKSLQKLAFEVAALPHKENVRPIWGSRQWGLFDRGVCAPEDVDFLLFCTQSPDYFLPATACLLQSRLGEHGWEQ